MTVPRRLVRGSLAVALLATLSGGGQFGIAAADAWSAASDGPGVTLTARTASVDCATHLVNQGITLAKDAGHELDRVEITAATIQWGPTTEPLLFDRTVLEADDLQSTASASGPLGQEVVGTVTVSVQPIGGSAAPYTLAFRASPADIGSTCPTVSSTTAPTASTSTTVPAFGGELAVTAPATPVRATPTYTG